MIMLSQSSQVILKVRAKMPRTRKNSKKRADKVITVRPPGKRRRDINAANVELRRSHRRTANTYATHRITANRLTLPPTFLDNAVKSETITVKKEAPVITSERNRHFLNSDLLALIPTAKREGPPDRHNARSLDNRFVNASAYYLTCLSSNRATCSNASETQIVGTEGDTEVNVQLTPHREDFEENYIEINNITTNVSTLNTTVIEKNRPINHKFCHNVFQHLKIKLRSCKRDCITSLKLNIEILNDILEGKRSPVSPAKPKMSTKRLSEDDYVNIPLVPQSQWVYSTPDKQNIKKFVFDEGSEKILPAVIRTSKKSKVLYDIKNEVFQQMNIAMFKSGQNIPIDRRYLKTICESAVDQEEGSQPKPSKKQRVENENESEKENVFSFVAPTRRANEFVFQPQETCVSNDVSTSGATIGCCNVFMSGAPENFIDIQEEIEKGTESVMDVSFETKSFEETIQRDLQEMEERCEHFDFKQCRSALPKACPCRLDNDPYETAPIDYHHQLLLATQRPAKMKTVRRTQKRHLLKAKSLSFDLTPPSVKVMAFEPKRLDMIRAIEDECLDNFEKEFPSLNPAESDNTNIIGIPHTVTSGALFETATSVTEMEVADDRDDVEGGNVQNTFKYYPRRNFDRE